MQRPDPVDEAADREVAKQRQSRFRGLTSESKVCWGNRNNPRCGGATETIKGVVGPLASGGGMAIAKANEAMGEARGGYCWRWRCARQE